MSIKVFVCDCRGEIKIPEKLDFGDAVKVYHHTHLCSPEGVKEIEKVFDSEDRIIIAGCTPRIAERFFTNYDPELINIREQVAWVGHDGNKIRDLISGAVNKAKVSTKVTSKKVKINNKSVLIIGAGVTGLEVARQVAENGHKVYLIEKEPFIGGMVAKLDRLYPEATPNSHTLYPLINDVLTRDNIEILAEAELTELKGGLGNYTATIKAREPSVTGCILCKKCEDVCPVEVDDQGKKRKAVYYMPTYPDSYAVDFEHCTKCGECVKVSPAKIDLEPKTRTIELEVGTVVAATGLSFFDATQVKEYGYGKYPNVLNTIEFERKVANGGINPKAVVIVGCAGSRDEHYLEYCSKICCMIGLKEAKLIKDRFPDTNVYMTYIDMRSYGELESFYTTVRDSHDVNFINGRPAEIFQRDEKLVVKTEDIALGDLLEIEADYVVLSTGFVPNGSLFKLLGVSSKEDFPIEYVASQLSIDSNPRGVFVAGAAAFPSNVKESLIGAREVAASINNLLSQDEVVIRTPVAKIDSEVCGAINCKVCVATCPYEAVKEIEGKIEVDELMCMGCGVCSATCGVGASQLEKYTDKEILAQVNGTITKGTVACFLCRWSAYEAADKAGYERLKYSDRVRIIRVPCTGRVDIQLVLGAFNSGASGVLVAGCYPDSCHYKSGNFKARRRFLLSRDMLKQLGIDSKRLRIEWIGKDESKKLVEILNEIGSM